MNWKYSSTNWPLVKRVLTVSLRLHLLTILFFRCTMLTNAFLCITVHIIYSIVWLRHTHIEYRMTSRVDISLCTSRDGFYTQYYNSLTAIRTSFMTTVIPIIQPPHRTVLFTAYRNLLMNNL